MSYDIELRIYRVKKGHYLLCNNYAAHKKQHIYLILHAKIAPLRKLRLSEMGQCVKQFTINMSPITQ